MAIDFAQYKFQSCGVRSPSIYNYSRWRVEELGGPDLRVPFACCALSEDQPQPYRNPLPRDLETSQGRDLLQHHSQRYTQGCLQCPSRQRPIRIHFQRRVTICLKMGYKVELGALNTNMTSVLT